MSHQDDDLEKDIKAIGDVLQGQLQGRYINTHTDDEAVDRFCDDLKRKLAKQRERGYAGWDDNSICDQRFLSDCLVEHVGKLDPIDVAAFCMFLNQRGESIHVESVASSDGVAAFNGKAIQLHWFDKLNEDGDWELIWKPILIDANGNVDIEQLKKELHDFSAMLRYAPAVYHHVTGGMLSKPLYQPSVVISAADDYLNKVVDQALEDAAAENKGDKN